ncbi:MAG: hypothetical protein QOI55_2917 [Actinomycetota bacterium]|jgi:hypothetical protein|nr:hypothetical protein [Actinomycetota bacterium]
MAERLRCVPLTSVWHSTQKCTRWPLMDYWSHAHMPVGGELCDECASLTRTAAAAS